MSEQFRRQSVFSPPKDSPSPFTILSKTSCSYLFQFAAEIPVLSPAHEAAGRACTAAWFLSHSVSSRSTHLSELSIPLCCAPVLRTSSELRPQSHAAAACTVHTADPFLLQQQQKKNQHKRKWKEMEKRKVSSQLVHVLHLLATLVFARCYRCQHDTMCCCCEGDKLLHRKSYIAQQNRLLWISQAMKYY